MQGRHGRVQHDTLLYNISIYNSIYNIITSTLIGCFLTSITALVLQAYYHLYIYYYS